MAKQTSLFDGVQISVIFGLVWARLTDYLFISEVFNRFINSCILSMRSLHLITWPALGIVLGIALYWELHCIGICIVWELHCNWNCIILWIALHWGLHCFGNCTAIGIALYCELHCFRNYIVLGIAMYWDLHCIEIYILLWIALY